MADLVVSASDLWRLRTALAAAWDEADRLPINRNNAIVDLHLAAHCVSDAVTALNAEWCVALHRLVQGGRGLLAWVDAVEAEVAAVEGAATAAAFGVPGLR
jgi:hypothetical protein